METSSMFPRYLLFTIISVALILLLFPTCSESGRIFELNLDGFIIKSRVETPIIERPAYTLSKDPDDVHFYLFSNPENVNETKEIVYKNTESLADSGFVPNQPTIFITHGFRSNLSSDMPQTLKNAFLAANANPDLNMNHNIIVVSWGALSTPLPPEVTASLYTLVTFNVPIVARRLVDFILFLRQQNVLALNSIHLIGHSLGSHVSGLAGRNIFLATGEKIPRVTGLDPAGPDYYPRLPDRNLMKDNAKFVEALHTNAGVLGDFTNDGHADFYPNGGAAQPGCYEGDRGSATTLGRCSHWYAYQLYAASITKKFLACHCDSLRISYPLGLCHSKCDEPVTLGYHCPPSTRGEFYLITTNPP